MVNHNITQIGYSALPAFTDQVHEDIFFCIKSQDIEIGASHDLGHIIRVYTAQN